MNQRYGIGKIVSGETPVIGKNHWLTDLGPKWRKLCKLRKSGQVYNSYPTEDWYVHVLGKPEDVALEDAKQQRQCKKKDVPRLRRSR